MGFGPVIIYGAGVCGLAIAQGLRMSNIKFYIFEPMEQSLFTSNDSTITISHSLPMLRQLLPKEALERLEDLDHVQDNDINVFEGKTCQLLRTTRSNDPIVRVEKRAFRDLCAQDIDVKYQHTLQNIEYTDDGNVYAVFTNGERYWGSLIVGADGPHSIVRQMIYGMEKATPKCAGAEYVCLTLSYPAAIAHAVCATGSGTSIAVVQECVVAISLLSKSDPQDAATWRFQIFMCWKKEKKRNGMKLDKEAQCVMKEKAKYFSEPFRASLLSTSDSVPIPIREVSSWTPTPWHSRGGRTTLAGNAAHCPLPSINQNWDNAIADAHSFVEIIRKIVVGDGIKSHTIPTYGHEITARALRQQAELNKDVLRTVVNHAVLNNGVFSEQILTRALNGSDTPETQSESSSRRSESEKSDRSRRQQPSKGRRALSRTSTWFRNQIDNLDVGAERGTAQTGWAQLGQREYGKRNFPDRDYRQFR